MNAYVSTDDGYYVIPNVQKLRVNDELVEILGALDPEDSDDLDIVAIVSIENALVTIGSLPPEFVATEHGLEADDEDQEEEEL